MLNKLLIFFVVLFVILGGLACWYWTRNPYSKDILKIEILGPNEADFSQEVEYTVKYKNNGNIRLEQLRLIFEYPENTLVGENFIRRQEVGPEELGDIYPGEEKTYAFKGRLFGKEGDLKTANAQLEFQPKNLNAKYEATTSFTTRIKPIPVTFDFDLPSKIEANKNFDFSINYYSVLNYSLSDLTVKILYPDQFEFLSSKPSSDNKSEWGIPLLNKAEGGRIDIEGKMSAELGEHKIFNAQLGMWRDDGQFILLKEINKEVEIIQPNLSIAQRINGEMDYTASPGDILHYEIFFRNLGDEPFTDMFLALTLSGEGYDFETIKTFDGQFKPGDKTIVWDWQNVSSLKFLDQGDEGKVEFWINLKDDWNIGSYNKKDALVKDTVLVSKVKQEFETKINSKLSLDTQVIPESSSLYTVNWQVKNSLNNVKDVKVKAVLPSNARVTGSVSPSESSSSFAFDSESREIVWSVGDMQAGDGVMNNPRIISFQVETPARRNSILLDQVRIVGEDEWTGKSIEENLDQIKIP